MSAEDNALKQYADYVSTFFEMTKGSISQLYIWLDEYIYKQDLDEDLKLKCIDIAADRFLHEFIYLRVYLGYLLEHITGRKHCSDIQVPNYFENMDEDGEDYRLFIDAYEKECKEAAYQAESLFYGGLSEHEESDNDDN